MRRTVAAVEARRRAGATEMDVRNTYWVTLLAQLASAELVEDPSSSGHASSVQRFEVLTELLVERPRVEALHAYRERRASGLEDSSLDTSEDPHVFERLLELEPTPVEWVDEGAFERVARTLASFGELVCPVAPGHSSAVADLAERAASEFGLGDEETQALRIAALLHDIGRASVPNSIWMRTGALDWAARERIRLHAYCTERVLGPIDSLAEITEIATAVNERLDGSGYPRQRSARALSRAARLLAVADMACALSEVRPHRKALSPGTVAHELMAEASLGRLDPRAVDAVLAALGLPDRVAPASILGLSGRELEVSQHLALGMSDKEIGATLHISPRTVQVHVSRILDKLGVRSRAGAAVWLVENDLASAGRLPARSVKVGRAPD